MAKILVVGGAGYIGSHFCKALAARGDTPIVFDNLSAGHAHAVQWGPLVTGDIRDGVALDRAFADHQPDAVMHFAAHIEVGEGERAPLAFWDNNVAGVVSLLKAMDRGGVATLVFSSTCAVYGEPERVPISEDEPRTPVSVYGRTKKAVEDLLADTAKTGRLRYASLRYFNACGASPDGEIGEQHDPETHLIPNALKAAAGLGPAMKLFGDDYPTPDGTCIRDYVHVMDLADAHLKALDLLLAGRESFACNIGTGNGLSVREILDAVEKVTGRAVPFTLAPRRSGDAVRLVADTSRASELLAFTPVCSSAEQIIADAWRFHAPQWGGAIQ
ncbi:UDP-glucose 4-epimerase GalE [Hyphomonadaceae bacterium BL14]|nr:UDP-glucose 4-epimerase GalE [Hyphomonadaceae bacterium BL14]